MNILVVGGGGREHAIAHSLSKSPLIKKIVVAPGNPGIEKFASCYPIAAEDIDGQCKLAKDIKADIVFIGPEIPLVAGLKDKLSEFESNIEGEPTVEDEAEIENMKAEIEELTEKANKKDEESKNAESDYWTAVEEYLNEQNAWIAEKLTSAADNEKEYQSQLEELSAKKAKMIADGSDEETIAKIDSVIEDAKDGLKAAAEEIAKFSKYKADVIAKYGDKISESLDGVKKQKDANSASIKDGAAKQAELEENFKDLRDQEKSLKESLKKAEEAGEDTSDIQSTLDSIDNELASIEESMKKQQESEKDLVSKNDYLDEVEKMINTANAAYIQLVEGGAAE